MILIPEIETVVILVPRTGSTSLRSAVLKRYPKSIALYRHMEADGVPFGYDRWHKVGVFREPVERLWSLYKYCATDEGLRAGYPKFAEKMRVSVGMPFDDWIVYNDVVFTDPFSSENGSDYYPQYAVHHPLPENRKSQFFYLRPDLGTQIFRYNRLHLLEKQLDIKLPAENASEKRPVPVLNNRAKEHVCRFLNWDIDMSEDWRKL